ncbi:MAG: SIS domain-containing protein [Armatimonadota bacterium]
MNIVKDYLTKLQETISELSVEQIEENINLIQSAHDNGKQVFLIGNGGSAAMASHFACDLQKGLKMASGKRLRAIALTDSIPIISAWANDTSYNNIFSEQLDSLADSGDLLIAISGSGNSPNIINAVEKANEMGLITVGWSGFDGGKLAKVVKHPLIINSDNMQRIEDVHVILAHVIFFSMVSKY